MNGNTIIVFCFLTLFAVSIQNKIYRSLKIYFYPYMISYGNKIIVTSMFEIFLYLERCIHMTPVCF